MMTTNMNPPSKDSMEEKIVEQSPLLKRGSVQCKTCKRIEKVNSADCLRYGWPKCHGYTMTLDVEDFTSPKGR